MIGKKFNRLTVVGEAEPYVSPKGCKKKRWLCKCDCENNTVVDSTKLKSGKVKSCGCLKIEKLVERSKSHGMSKTKMYEIWLNMIQRCENPNTRQYKDWGGRGIKVCKEWIEDFINFYNDMNPTYKNGLSLERKDNDSGYCRSNCEWADRTKQTINQRTRSDNTSGLKGLSWHSQNKKWQVSIMVKGNHIYVGKFEDWFEAACARKSAENKYHKEYLYGR